MEEFYASSKSTRTFPFFAIYLQKLCSTFNSQFQILTPLARIIILMIQTTDNGCFRSLACMAAIPGLTILLAGCGTPEAAHQINDFCDACNVTATNTSEAFQLVEDNHYETEVSRAAYNLDSNGLDVQRITHFYSADQNLVRIEVIQGLQTYAANLSVLMGNHALDNFDQETTKLGDALSKLNSDAIEGAFKENSPISAQDIQIFTTAINALGHWLIHFKQDKEAKQAIGNMQKPIDDICNLLLRDLDTLEIQFESDSLERIKNEDGFLRKNFAAYQQNPYELRRAVDNEIKLSKRKQAGHELIEQLKLAVTTLQSTHARLEKVFDKDSANINSLIRQFGSEAHRIGAYYNSLNSTE